MIPAPETPQKGNRQVLLELFHESIGLESGILRTAQALWREPQNVLKSYMANERTYISPFKILLTSLSLWILINSFIIDWYAIWGKMTADYLDWLTTSVFPMDGANPEKVKQFKSDYVAFVSRFMGDLFSKIYVPLVVVVLPLSAWFAHKSCAKYGANFRSLIATNAYVMGANVFSLVIVSTLTVINTYALAVIAVSSLLLLFFGINIFILIPPRRFFAENGKVIEKTLIRGNLMAVFVVMGVLAVGYGVWFVWGR
jgi:hypothetical protein